MRQRGTYGKAQLKFEQCEVERVLVAGWAAQFHEAVCRVLGGTALLDRR